MKTRKDPRALVGFATADDAAVYRLNAREAVVSTVDFFPPVVDDPFAYGQIAAANALSDVWAMGARPLFALNLVAFPTQALPMETLARILEGGQNKADEAGIPILGGHSVDDPEPKYGMAVTGVVHPRRILTNAGGRPGDVLLLTKPLGSGIATTAIKQGIASPELVRIRRGCTTPVTAMPYFGSGSSTEWPPRMGMPASSALLCPPSRMRASVSTGSAWVGKATRFRAKSGRAPMAHTSESALAAPICP